MRHFDTRKKRSFFTVLESTGAAQAAMMTLAPGQSTSDEPVNEHPRCEQWVFVVSGTGRAVVGKRRTKLADGSLLLIEQGEPHQITNTGRRRPLVTLNLYAPPAYTTAGDLKTTARVPTLKSLVKRA